MDEWMDGRSDPRTNRQTWRTVGQIDGGMDGQTQTEHKMKAQYVFYDEDDLGLSDCP